MARNRRTIDINLLTSQIVAEATSEVREEIKPEMNPAAVALGRLGGLKGGMARKDKLSPERRKEIAQKASKARWGKTK